MEASSMGDSERTALEYDAMDLVVASLALCYIADWVPVLTELHRVLVGDGAIVFSAHPASDWQTHSRDNYFAIK
jgi:SAM-dependent methyltransferase